jgi:beta-xylosidase
MRLHTILLACALYLLSFSSLAAQQAAPQAYYLMTSHGEPETTGLRLVLSADGYRWTALNQDRSVLAPQVGAGKVFRDPSIARDAQGTFHIVWTIAWGTQRDKGIGYVRSKDLIHFDEQRLIAVMENEPKTINVWAPELFWDEVQQQWMIFWASTVEGKFPETLHVFDGRMNSRIYYTTTKDFQRFQPSKLLFGPREMMGIDAFILHPAPGQYYMFFKGDRAEAPKRGLFVARAARAEGPYTLNPNLLTAESQGWIEAPSVIKIKDE